MYFPKPILEALLPPGAQALPDARGDGARAARARRLPAGDRRVPGGLGGRGAVRLRREILAARSYSEMIPRNSTGAPNWDLEWGRSSVPVLHCTGELLAAHSPRRRQKGRIEGGGGRGG
jgi:hypothetical protein